MSKKGPPTMVTIKLDMEQARPAILEWLRELRLRRSRPQVEVIAGEMLPKLKRKK